MIRLGVKSKSKQVPPGGAAYLGGAAKRRAAAKAARRAMSTASIVSIKAPSMMRTGGFSFKATGGKELNFVDTALALANVSTTATLTLLNGLAQGTTASTRIGRRIQMKSIEMKGFANAQSTSDFQTVRFAIVLDKQANAAAPAFTDIYDAATPYALRNISNKARFWVLWDSGLKDISGNNSFMCDTSVESLEIYKRINIPVQYNAGTAGTVGDIQTNALYFVAIGSKATGTTSAMFTGNIRIRYDDS